MQTKSAHVGEITLPLGCANVHYEEPVSQLELQPSQVLAASKPNQSTAHHGRILHCAMSEHGHVPASFSRVVATADSPAATCVCDKIKCQIQIFRPVVVSPHFQHKSWQDCLVRSSLHRQHAPASPAQAFSASSHPSCARHQRPLGSLLAVLSQPPLEILRLHFSPPVLSLPIG